MRTNTDLARAREGGLDVPFFSIWPECDYCESGGADTARQRQSEKRQDQKYVNLVTMRCDGPISSATAG